MANTSQSLRQPWKEINTIEAKTANLEQTSWIGTMEERNSNAKLSTACLQGAIKMNMTIGNDGEKQSLRQPWKDIDATDAKTADLEQTNWIGTMEERNSNAKLLTACLQGAIKMNMTIGDDSEKQSLRQPWKEINTVDAKTADLEQTSWIGTMEERNSNAKLRTACLQGAIKMNKTIGGN